MDHDLIEAALLVVSKAEIMAKMRDEQKEYRGCTAAYIARILTTDDERFKDRDLFVTRWEILEAFAHHIPGRVRQCGRYGRQRTARWTTLTPDQWQEHFE